MFPNVGDYFIFINEMHFRSGFAQIPYLYVVSINDRFRIYFISGKTL